MGADTNKIRGLKLETELGAKNGVPKIMEMSVNSVYAIAGILLVKSSIEKNVFTFLIVLFVTAHGVQFARGHGQAVQHAAQKVARAEASSDSEDAAMAALVSATTCGSRSDC